VLRGEVEEVTGGSFGKGGSHRADVERLMHFSGWEYIRILLIDFLNCSHIPMCHYDVIRLES